MLLFPESPQGKVLQVRGTGVHVVGVVWSLEGGTWRGSQILAGLCSVIPCATVEAFSPIKWVLVPVPGDMNGGPCACAGGRPALGLHQVSAIIHSGARGLAWATERVLALALGGPW